MQNAPKVTYERFLCKFDCVTARLQISEFSLSILDDSPETTNAVGGGLVTSSREMNKWIFQVNLPLCRLLCKREKIGR